VSFLRCSLLALSTTVFGCGAAPTLTERRIEAGPAVEALREGSFDEATKHAGRTLEKDPQNPEALMVRAITRHRATVTGLALDGRTVVLGALDGGRVNQRYLRTVAEQAEADLAAIEADLGKVAESPDVSLELCLACWKDVDWTGDGRVNRRDELLLQIEVDEHGEPLPEDDPRRKPTFRFDHGDIAWARAFVGFERAALDVILAYDYTGLNEVLVDRRGRSKRVVLKLVDPPHRGGEIALARGARPIRGRAAGLFARDRRRSRMGTEPAAEEPSDAAAGRSGALRHVGRRGG
jgi:hypothetical protein